MLERLYQILRKYFTYIVVDLLAILSWNKYRNLRLCYRYYYTPIDTFKELLIIVYIREAQITGNILQFFGGFCFE